MKVALLAPKPPASKARFGAERLTASLYKALQPLCDADLLELPVDETTIDGVLRSYLDFYDLDVSAYDCVISTKNPTFMVQHANHICWLVHQIRVFYDRFEDEFGHVDSQALVHLRSQQKEIHTLDNFAFSRVRKIFSIGHEVSRRLLHFNGITSEVLHPVHEMSGLYCGSPQHYLLMPGRLHRWKRVDLAIRAVRASRTSVDLLIAGSGEDERTFRDVAAGDSRIKFLGYVSDEEMVELYAHALGVLFVPKDEDFGYVTIEAMMSHKPLITCLDSGEPTQFVQHEKTGLVVRPDVSALAEAVRWLVENAPIAQQLGENAFRDAPKSSWSEVAQKLLEQADGCQGSSAVTLPRTPQVTQEEKYSLNGRPKRIRAFVSDNQVLDPPVGGGRLRIYQLYRELAALDWNVTYVGAYDWPGPLFRDQYLFPHFREIVTPLTVPHFRLNSYIQRMVRGRTVIDVTIPFLMKCSPRFAQLAGDHAADASVIVVAHPWVYPHVKRRPGQLLIYDSQNCEYLIKQRILGDTFIGRMLVARVRKLEKELCHESDLIFACSRADAASFVNLYGISERKIILVPNGVDIEELQPASAVERANAKQQLGFRTESHIAVFIGSGYQPNLEAAEFIVESMAPLLPTVDFVIVGGVRDCASHLVARSTANVRWEGVVDQDRKMLLYKAADVAINPMFSGSGTNLKMLDFFAAGLPVVTTQAGARGLEATDGTCYVGDPATLVPGLQQLMASPDLRSQMSASARRLAVEKYSWKRIAAQAYDAVLSTLQANSTFAPKDYGSLD